MCVICLSCVSFFFRVGLTLLFLSLVRAAVHDRSGLILVWSFHPKRKIIFFLLLVVRHENQSIQRYILPKDLSLCFGIGLAESLF